MFKLALYLYYQFLHDFCVNIEFSFYLKVFRQQQLAGPEEAEDVTENLSVPVDEIVLLQTVQHDGFGAVKETTDPENENVHMHMHTHTRLME